jgi:hypothetical protein
MSKHRVADNPLFAGLIIGIAFGCVNLLFSWLVPLLDDNAATLLTFYGPMFFLWGLLGFRAARRERRLVSGALAGMLAAFATFCVFDVIVIVRVNVFLGELTGRTDWQDMMRRYRASDAGSLRSFVTLDYLKGAPFKIGTASAIGAVMGAIGGCLGRLTPRRTAAAA